VKHTAQHTGDFRATNKMIPFQKYLHNGYTAPQQNINTTSSGKQKSRLSNWNVVFWQLLLPLLQNCLSLVNPKLSKPFEGPFTAKHFKTLKETVFFLVANVKFVGCVQTFWLG